jgi:hypothetical protein
MKILPKNCRNGYKKLLGCFPNGVYCGNTVLFSEYCIARNKGIGTV